MSAADAIPSPTTQALQFNSASTNLNSGLGLTNNSKNNEITTRSENTNDDSSQDQPILSVFEITNDLSEKLNEMLLEINKTEKSLNSTFASIERRLTSLESKLQIK
ncbi:unnamed protein product [[Candida] boidinii]|nr:hypothetical protein B5S33_g2573 [[Candida] boidinii]GMF86814.1 unnamed protein product [[Candida] boidinii]